MVDEEVKRNNDDAQLKIVDEDDLVLTTKDNPYNPKTEYAKWRRWDVDNGYHTEEYLARITDVDIDVDIDDEVTIKTLTNKAVQEILEHDVLKVYILV